MQPRLRSERCRETQPPEMSSTEVPPRRCPAAEFAVSTELLRAAVFFGAVGRRNATFE
jgi:hypothetical protein